MDLTGAVPKPLHVGNTMGNLWEGGKEHLVLPVSHRGSRAAIPDSQSHGQGCAQGEADAV